METVLADSRAPGQFGVDRIGIGLGRQVDEKGGIEYRDMGHLGQQLAGGLDPGDAGRIVQGSQRGQLPQGIDHLVGDPGRGGEAIPTMHGAVGDGDGGVQVGAMLAEHLEHLGQCRLVIRQQFRQLELLRRRTQHLMVDGAGGRIPDLLHQALGQ